MFNDRWLRLILCYVGILCCYYVMGDLFFNRTSYLFLFFGLLDCIISTLIKPFDYFSGFFHRYINYLLRGFKV